MGVEVGVGSLVSLIVVSVSIVVKKLSSGFES
jgi:hypothetical protein